MIRLSIDFTSSHLSLLWRNYNIVLDGHHMFLFAILHFQAPRLLKQPSCLRQHSPHNPEAERKDADKRRRRSKERPLEYSFLTHNEVVLCWHTVCTAITKVRVKVSPVLSLVSSHLPPPPVIHVYTFSASWANKRRPHGINGQYGSSDLFQELSSSLGNMYKIWRTNVEHTECAVV